MCRESFEVGMGVRETILSFVLDKTGVAFG
jgi:hypothetical protein